MTTFTDIEGKEYRAAGDQTEFEVDHEDPGKIKVWLKTHEKEITIAAGTVLMSTAILVLQRNRSQRKKMNKRYSSYNRPPRKKKNP